MSYDDCRPSAADGATALTRREQATRRSFALVFLFGMGIGCGTTSKPDTNAAREFLRRVNMYAENIVIEEPEYAAIPKIPSRGAGGSAPDRAAACGVRVKFLYRDGSRTTHDDWVVWVSSDHKAIGSAGNGEGDNWRPYVRSFAKE